MDFPISWMMSVVTSIMEEDEMLPIGTFIKIKSLEQIRKAARAYTPRDLFERGCYRLSDGSYFDDDMSVYCGQKFRIEDVEQYRTRPINRYYTEGTNGCYFTIPMIEDANVYGFKQNKRKYK
jgi:hypothetical protein